MAVVDIKDRALNVSDSVILHGTVTAVDAAAIPPSITLEIEDPLLVGDTPTPSFTCAASRAEKTSTPF